MRILLLEDDEATASAIEKGLNAKGYDILRASDVPTAQQLLSNHTVDAAVLDVMVPGGTGYDILGALKQIDESVPVLMLTARDSIKDRVAGLEKGADDYLVKPFAFAELLARLRALERRTSDQVNSLRSGNLELDLRRRSASCHGIPVDLTQTEFRLLSALLERRSEVINRKVLLEEVWGYRFVPSTNVVDVHVTRLRRKLESAGARTPIRSVRGLGYVID